MAYTYKLTKNQPDSHQSQPWAVACFLPYRFPDTFHIKPDQRTVAKALSVDKVVVVSDPINIKVSTAKGGISHTAEIELASGDLNYSQMLFPGDHAMIWLHNDAKMFTQVANDVFNLKKANYFNSGFKFEGKIFSVREVLTTMSTGVKTLRYIVSIQGFTELNSMIYYNPLLKNAADDPLKFYAKISEEWNSVLSNTKDGGIPVPDILDFFIDVFLGRGPSGNLKNIAGFKELKRSPNEAYLVPDQVASLLGINYKSKFQTSYADILHTIFGVQNYNGESFLPEVVNKNAVQKSTPTPLRGRMISLPDNFNNVSIWSLLDAHKNSMLNEMYCTPRLNENKEIVPTLIVRQIPFTSKFFSSSSIKHTKFTDLPRWVADDSIVVSSYNVGTTNATRYNFVQVYGQLRGQRADEQGSLQQQIAEGNFDVDTLDIIRNGSKNFIASSNADVSVDKEGKTTTNINIWKQLVSDWYINMHLKYNGSITMAGIAEPICIGDNFEYDNKLFHIEAVAHQYSVAEDGTKGFYTTLSLSNGVLTDGNYVYTQRLKARKDAGDTNLPGYSDEEQYINDVPISSTVGSSSKDKNTPVKKDS